MIQHSKVLLSYHLICLALLVSAVSGSGSGDQAQDMNIMNDQEEDIPEIAEDFQDNNNKEVNIGGKYALCL